MSYLLSVMLTLLMAGQSGLGLVFPDQYRDAEWIRATWFGNDWITLVLGVPLLATGLLLERRGSVRGRLLWLGAFGYGVYNYAFYLFGAAMNVFLPLYILAFLLAVVTLTLALSGTNVGEVAAQVRSRVLVRFTGTNWIPSSGFAFKRAFALFLPVQPIFGSYSNEAA